MTTQHNTIQHKRKKLFGIVTGVMAVAAITIYSCKKEDVLQVQNGYNFNLSVHEIPDEGKALSLNSNTCLSFASISDYTTAVTNPTDTQQTTLTNLIKSFTNFTSYTTKYPNSLLFQGETFTDLLNPDGVIMIGGNYFKVDPTVEKVFVLPQADVAFYYDLISPNPSSGKVVMFSFYEEILDLIAAGALNNTQVVSVQVPEVMTATTQKSLRSFLVKTVKAVVNAISEAVVNVTSNVNKISTTVTNTIHTVFNTGCTDPIVGRHQDGGDLKNQVGISTDAHYNTFGIYFHLFSQVYPVNGYPNQYRFGFVGGIGSTVKPIKRDSG
jgi:hypothetical protein